MRFLAAPWVGLIESGAWLKNAAHANSCARRLADGIGNLPGVSLAYPSEANAVFVQAPPPVLDALRARGWRFYSFIGGAARFMCGLGRRSGTGRRAGGGPARCGAHASGVEQILPRETGEDQQRRLLLRLLLRRLRLDLDLHVLSDVDGRLLMICSPPLSPSRSSTVLPKSR